MKALIAFFTLFFFIINTAFTLNFSSILNSQQKNHRIGDSKASFEMFTSYGSNKNSVSLIGPRVFGDEFTVMILPFVVTDSPIVFDPNIIKAYSINDSSIEEVKVYGPDEYLNSIRNKQRWEEISKPLDAFGEILQQADQIQLFGVTLVHNQFT